MKRHRTAQLEALLFTHGSPLTRKSAAVFLGCSLDEVDSIASSLAEERRESGVIVVNDGVSLSLTSSPGLSDFMRGVNAKERTAPLSNAAQETLAIIAYVGPIVKTDLDFLRGVNTQYTVRQLTVRGLIQETVSVKSRALEVTAEFLAHLGARRKQDLPEYAAIHRSLHQGLEAARGDEGM